MTSSSATLSSSSFSSTSALSSSKFRFKFPSFSRTSSLSSRAKPFTASSSTTTHNISGEIRHCSLSRRRGLAFTATLPFLLPLHEFVDSVAAKAVESGSGQSEYLRIKEEIIKVVTKGKAAGVLRLVFHDAGTYEMDENSGGMNGSIVYELERPENVGLKKSLKVLEKAKKEIEAIQSVSWADMIAVGGAEAVSICGGPKIPVTLGRLDSGEPDPEGKMPEESLDASGLKQCFRRKGFSTQELVALSGAHTLGSKGFGSPVAFDNSYFKILLEKPWNSSAGMTSMIGLPSDRAIVEDDECLRWITKYADDQNMFFEDFKNAYMKLVNCGAKWKSKHSLHVLSPSLHVLSP
ncbi:hypothetical protein ERO13_D06G100300v2 [Gossypium hirsutum]|uniref:L-ascorbate peroxidase n=1 Tax=Gossypium hirsutum TaxID=3635 RepID=A0ABM3A902_GOSHI|nr:putative L-ascorbate peroxidase 6 isoform X4 [Gossypium hirsutum]KAG4141865.1 hypothetical protein ERO13_D06G100300v2 [Gossypium hirsutum]KAG4141866.1 hypothetical protein ERO13_D06G100300v2 [Gossypium hirsutum]